jgi:VWFA-related protein
VVERLHAAARRTRRGIELIGLATLAAAGGGALPQAPPVATFPTETQLVTIDALVLDRDGRPVPGLTASDFRVEEDGRAREIVSFEAFDLGARPRPSDTGSPAGPAPSSLRPAMTGGRTFVVLVDDLGLAAARQRDVQRAIDRFAVEGLRDGDELLLSATSGELAWTARMPEGREDVGALAARLRGRKLSETASDYMSDWEAFRITRFESPTGAGLESSGASAGSDAPPGGGGGAVGALGASLTERVVARWLERRACDPLALGLCRAMVAGRARTLDQARVNRTRDVLARVDQAVFALSRQKGRKALLLLSEGFLNDPDLDAARLVAGRCREAHIAVYFVDVRGLQTGLDELSAASAAGAPNSAELSLMRQESLEFQAAGSVALAEDTGGAALRDTNDLGGAAVRIAEESRVYYLLGISPPPGKGPREWRRLKVSTSRSGLRVRARRGYTLRSAAEIDREERARRPASRRESVPPEVGRALASGADVDEIPVRSVTFTFGSRPEGRVHALVALEADLGRIANLGGQDRPATVLSLSVVVTHRDTGEVRRTDEQVRLDAGQGGPDLEGWLTLTREFDLRPGVNQARVVVRDEFVGRTGAVSVRFLVPAPEGLRLSTPVLTDRALSRPGQAPRPVLVARREFGTRGTLYGQFEVYGTREPGGAGVETSWELRRADGVAVRTGPPGLLAPDAQGRLVKLLQMPLDGLSPGVYELVLRVEDRAAGTAVDRTEALRLE